MTLASPPSTSPRPWSPGSWLRRAQRRLGLPPDVLTSSGKLPRLYVISSHISDADFPRYYRVGPAGSGHVLRYLHRTGLPVALPPCSL
jgi:hypothetical protein